MSGVERNSRNKNENERIILAGVRRVWTGLRINKTRIRGIGYMEGRQKKKKIRKCDRREIQTVR